MKKTILVGALLTVGASMLLSACGQSPLGKAEDDFVTGCERGGAPHSACTCVFDRVLAKYGKEQMLVVANSNWQTVPPDFGKSMAQAVLQCRQ